MSDETIPGSIKIVRAIDGDDWFVRRIDVMCELAGVEPSRQVRLTVAQAVVDHIEVTGDATAGYTVSTSGVTDEAIIAALPAQAEATEEEAA